MQNGTQQERHRIFSHILQTKFFHIEDSLEIGKLRLFAGEYQRGKGASATAYHYIDWQDALEICFSILRRDVKHTEYKGSPSGEKGPISRVLKIAFSKKGEDKKLWVQLQNGPGKVMPTGAIQPAGNATAEVSIPFTLPQSRKLALVIQCYLQAWMVSQFENGRPAPTATPQPRRPDGDVPPAEKKTTESSVWQRLVHEVERARRIDLGVEIARVMALSMFQGGFIHSALAPDGDEAHRNRLVDSMHKYHNFLRNLKVRIIDVPTLTKVYEILQSVGYKPFDIRKALDSADATSEMHDDVSAGLQKLGQKFERR